MKKQLIFLALFCIALSGKAQYNLPVFYDQHWTLHSSKYIPSKLGDDYGTFNATLLNPYLYLGNSGFDLENLGNMNNAKVDKAISQMEESNVVGMGMDLDIFGMSYKIKKRDKEYMSFSFFATERIGSNFIYSRDFFDLIWNGNAKFENKKADLTLGFNAHWLREYALGWSMPLDIPSVGDDVKIKAGARVKYLQGFGAISFPKSNISLATGAEGRSLLFETDYTMNIAGYDGKDTPDSPFKSRGNGFGVDLSGTVSFMKNFEASLAVVDIGSVKFKNETYQYSRRSEIDFQGIPIGDIIGNNDFNVSDSIVAKFKGDEASSISFSNPLPTRLILQGEYKTQKTTKKKNREYYDKRACFTYIQGFNNIPGTTTKPFFSAGYNHSFNYVFTAGLSAQYGGYGRFNVGLNGSLRLGGLRIGIGTTNILGTTSLVGSGVDFTFLTGITI